MWPSRNRQLFWIFTFLQTLNLSSSNVTEFWAFAFNVCIRFYSERFSGNCYFSIDMVKLNKDLETSREMRNSTNIFVRISKEVVVVIIINWNTSWFCIKIADDDFVGFKCDVFGKEYAAFVSRFQHIFQINVIRLDFVPWKLLIVIKKTSEFSDFLE